MVGGRRKEIQSKSILFFSPMPRETERSRNSWRERGWERRPKGHGGDRVNLDVRISQTNEVSNDLPCSDTTNNLPRVPCGSGLGSGFAPPDPGSHCLSACACS